MWFNFFNTFNLGLVLIFFISTVTQAQIIIYPDNTSTNEIEVPIENNTPAKPVEKNKIKIKKTMTEADPLQKVETAKGIESTNKSTQDKNKSKNSFVIGLDTRSYKYEEVDVVSHQGLLFGAWGLYVIKFNPGDLIFNTSLIYGQLTYDGSLCTTASNVTTCTPTQVSQTDIIHKSNVLWQFSPLGRESGVNFKIGLGYRYLSDNYTDVGFYQRTGLWAYVPVGVGFKLPINSNYEVNSNLMYQHIIYGGINSKLSEVNSTADDIYLKQTGRGIEIEVGLTYQKKYHVSGYYESWSLDASETANSNVFGLLLEPANSAISYGLKLGYDFY